MTNTLMKDPRIIVALDYPDVHSALATAKRLEPGLCRLKVGNELFTTGGPGVVKSLQDLGFDIFLDLKFHDIPNTVAGAVSAAARLGVWMVNVHAAGGIEMLRAAKEAVDGFQHPPILIAVTVLTSLTSEALSQIGWSVSAPELVQQLAKLAWQAGLDGVVCSAQEADMLNGVLKAEDASRNPVLVTPGIRPQGSNVDDQSRIMTPVQAVVAGSSYLVIGRPITQSSDPLGVLRNITEEIAGA